MHSHDPSPVLALHTDHGVLRGVTPNHHLWSATREDWVEAGSLEPGEVLRVLGAGHEPVAATLQRIGSPEPSDGPVWDITVAEGPPTYFADGVLVHNKSEEDPFIELEVPDPVMVGEEVVLVVSGWSASDMTFTATRGADESVELCTDVPTELDYPHQAECAWTPTEEGTYQVQVEDDLGNTDEASVTVAPAE